MDTSDYIKNKKQNILFQNVIDNNFKNVNNIIFRSENKSNNIFLKSVGGYNINSYSTRLDLAYGRSKSESFLFNNDSDPIKKLNPSCNNDKIIKTVKNKSINLNFDINNSNFLVNDQNSNTHVCKNLLSKKSKFNNHLLQQNLNLSSIRKFVNYDNFINLRSSLLLGEQKCNNSLIDNNKAIGSYIIDANVYIYDINYINTIILTTKTNSDGFFVIDKNKIGSDIYITISGGNYKNTGQEFKGELKGYYFNVSQKNP